MINYVATLNKDVKAVAASGKGSSGEGNNDSNAFNRDVFDLTNFSKPLVEQYFGGSSLPAGISSTPSVNTTGWDWKAMFNSNPNQYGISPLSSTMSSFGSAAGGLASLYGMYMSNKNYGLQKQAYEDAKADKAKRFAERDQFAKTWQSNAGGLAGAGALAGNAAPKLSGGL